MNTTRISRLVKVAAMAVALVVAVGFSADVKAQNGAKGGGAKLIAKQGPSVAASAVASDSQKMACSKCKEEYSRTVDLSARGANKPTVFTVKHLCPGCGNEWSVVGHGKAKVSVANHKCTSCGAISATCCANEK